DPADLEVWQPVLARGLLDQLVFFHHQIRQEAEPAGAERNLDLVDLRTGGRRREQQRHAQRADQASPHEIPPVYSTVSAVLHSPATLLHSERLNGTLPWLSSPMELASAAAGRRF